jgi:hypothetical protein
MTPLTTRQVVTLALTFPKKDGSNGTVEAGSVKAASSDETQIRVTVAADGNSIDVEGVAPTPADAAPPRISMSADADPGDGVVEIHGTEDFEVSLDPRDDLAASIVLTASAPRDKAPAAAA